MYPGATKRTFWKRFDTPDEAFKAILERGKEMYGDNFEYKYSQFRLKNAAIGSDCPAAIQFRDANNRVITDL